MKTVYKKFFENKLNISFNTKKTGRNDYDALFKNKSFKSSLLKMSPLDFLKRTDSRRYKLDRNKIERFKKLFSSSKVVLPTPVMIFDFNKKFDNTNDLSNWHDGMHRVTALYELGLKEIPVIIFENIEG
jgi:hypothetical protein